jgi:hypothetical protein
MCGTSHTTSAEPVSRTRSRKVGLDRFDLTMPRHKKYTTKRFARENINAHNKHVAFYSWNTSTHRSSSDTTEGFHSIVNQKKFLWMRTRKPRSNLGDIINERDIWDLYTLEEIAPRKRSIERGWCSRTSLLLYATRSDPTPQVATPPRDAHVQRTNDSAFLVQHDMVEW